MPIETEPDEIDTAHALSGVEAAPLRQVRDGCFVVTGRAVEDPDASLVDALEAEDRFEERRLAGAVRSEHGDKLAGRDGDVDIAEGVLSADRDVDVFEFERERAHRPVALASASRSWRSWRDCQS